MRRIDRRGVLKLGAATGAGLAFGQFPAPTHAQSQRLAVLSPKQPDPRAPGVDGFASDLLDGWKTDHDTAVDYAVYPFFELQNVIRAELQSVPYIHDVLYNWSTIPEHAGSLLEIGPRLSAELIGDLPASQAASISWQQKQYGVVPTLSLMLLFYNRSLMEDLGITEPPRTWDDMKALSSAFGGDVPNGLLMPYGARAGIGGVASVWMAFLQQAGGHMYDNAGKPVFDDAPGVDALQFMLDLLPLTNAESLTNLSYGNVAFRMAYDTAAMTFSFPAFWDVLNNNAPVGEGKIIPTVMPAGPENNATINGVDAWTIASASPNPDLALQLIEFYLSPDVQKRQLAETGWLPARRSVLADPEVQAASSVAAVLLEQSNAPYDSFVTPNYLAITDTIGLEIQKALRGEQTAAQAIRAARTAIDPLIVW